MRFCNIASGSSGNCTYIGDEETHLIVDAGISGKRIEAGLNDLELTTPDLEGILITHEHSDHIGGLGVMVNCTLPMPPPLLTPVALVLMWMPYSPGAPVVTVGL